jgi:UDP-glucuronate decarboxylase
MAGLSVLVAGGAGFLGSHLCHRLMLDGASVVCIDNFSTGDRDNLRELERQGDFMLVEGDVVEPLPAQIGLQSFDRIYNLACTASPPRYQAEPEQTLLTSVMGTHRLLRLAEACGARFLLTSSSEVYGDAEVHPQVESYWGNANCVGPRACYDEGKRAAEALCFDYDRQGRADVRIARIFNTFGPGQSAGDGRLMPSVVSRALTGDEITVFGDGSQTRSLCYVTDTVDGLVRLMEHEGPQPGPVNIGAPHERTVADIVSLVLALTRSTSRVTFGPPVVDDPQRRRPDIAKAQDLLGWMPTTTFEDGVSAMAAWFRENRTF